MQIRILILSLFLTGVVSAQTASADTVKPGCYVPFDTNFVSCKVVVMPAGRKSVSVNATGNKISDSLVTEICRLPRGSVVTYDEVTVLKRGVLEKASSVRYVIGNRNTCVVKRDPSIPDTLPVKEIASKVFDQHVYSFTISWVGEGSFHEYNLTGNGVYGEAKSAIEALPSGTRIIFHKIHWQDDDGTERVLPMEAYVVR